MDCIQEMQQVPNPKSKINIFYTVLVVLYPLFAMYSFMGTKLSISDVGAFCIIAMMMFFHFRTFSFNALFLGFGICIGFHACLMLLLHATSGNYDVIDLLGTTMRLLLIYFILSMSGKHFLRELGKKILIFIAVISTLYMFVQLVFAAFDIYVEGGIPFLNRFAFRNDVVGYVDDVIRYKLTYRPRSIFAEPAHYCQYTVVAIALMLFDEKIKFLKKLPWLVLLAAGIVFSMSLLGWCSMALVGGIWILWIIKKYRLKWGLLAIMVAVPLVLIVLWNTDAVRHVIQAKFFDQNILSDPRFSGAVVLETLQEGGLISMFLGNGLIGTEVYYTGVTRILFAFGLLGFCMILFMLINVLYQYRGRKTILSAVLILVLAFLSIGSELIFGPFVLVYLAFLNTDTILPAQKNKKGN